MEDIRQRFNEWLGKNVRSLDNGTFGQVNKDYKIEVLMTCKHCNKKAMKSCCTNYRNSDRSSKKIVRNLELFYN